MLNNYTNNVPQYIILSKKKKKLTTAGRAIWILYIYIYNHHTQNALEVNFIISKFPNAPSVLLLSFTFTFYIILTNIQVSYYHSNLCDFAFESVLI